MKKIAIISDTCPPSKGGGISTAHFNLYLSLKEKGYLVNIFTYLEHNSENIDEKEIFRFGASKYEKKWLSFKNKIIRKIQKWMTISKPNGFVYQNNIVLLSNIGARKINKQLDIFNPDIVIIPDFGAPGFSLAKKNNTKFVYVSHNNPIRLLHNPLILIHSVEDALNAISKEQISLHKMDVVVCPSLYMKKIFDDTFTYKKEVIVIPNIVNELYIKNIPKMNLHSKLYIDPLTPIVYIPSAGSSIKGERYIIEIVRRISKSLNNNVAFYLSGELSDCQKYELINMHIDNIYTGGYVSYSDNIGYIKDCTICVSPTLMESFGMALLEALFCDLPCVSFDVGGNLDIIKNNVNGFIVPYLDIEALIEKSILLLTNTLLQKDFKHSIQEAINGKFSTEKITNEYIELIEKL